MMITPPVEMTVRRARVGVERMARGKGPRPRQRTNCMTISPQNPAKVFKLPRVSALYQADRYRAANGGTAPLYQGDTWLIQP